MAQPKESRDGSLSGPDKYRAGYTQDCPPDARRAVRANWLAVAALLVGTLASRADDGLVGFTYRATPISSFIQLISPDGLVFKWGEPAHGGVSEEELAVFPLGSAQPLPLPASGRCTLGGCHCDGIQSIVGG